MEQVVILYRVFWPMNLGGPLFFSHFFLWHAGAMQHAGHEHLYNQPISDRLVSSPNRIATYRHIFTRLLNIHIHRYDHTMS